MPLGKKAPPNPGTDCDAITSAVAVMCRNDAGDIEREKGVDTKSFAHNSRASPTIAELHGPLHLRSEMAKMGPVYQSKPGVI